MVATFDRMNKREGGSIKIDAGWFGSEATRPVSIFIDAPEATNHFVAPGYSFLKECPGAA